MDKKTNEISVKEPEEVLITETTIQNLIYVIRGQQVMLDRDLANLYGVDTKVLNQAVKRNIERFPVRFRFQLSDLERDKLVTNCDRLQMLKHSNVNPFVFTEQEVVRLQPHGDADQRTVAKNAIVEYKNLFFGS